MRDSFGVDQSREMRDSFGELWKFLAIAQQQQQQPTSRNCHD